MLLLHCWPNVLSQKPNTLLGSLLYHFYAKDEIPGKQHIFISNDFSSYFLFSNIFQTNKLYMSVQDDPSDIF